MSSAIISGCGKLNTNGGESNLLFLNMIQIPADNADIPTQIMFLAHKYVTNFTDFLEVLDYYKEKNLNLQTCGGRWVEHPSSITYTYVIEYIYYHSAREIKIMYKDNANSHISKRLALTANPPTNWEYYTL